MIRAGGDEQPFLAAVLGSLTDAVVACDADGQLTLFNPAADRLHGLPAEPLPFEQWAEHYDLLLSDGRTPMGPADVPLVRALQGEVVRDVEMCVRPRGGDLRVLLASGRQIRDDDGALLGAVVAMHDVTDVRRAARTEREQHQRAEQVRQAEQALGQLQRLNEAAGAMNAAPTVELALQVCTDRATLLTGARQGVASLNMGAQWSQAITAMVLSPEYEAWAGYDVVPDGSGIYAYVCETNVALRLTQAELETHPRWQGFGAHAAEHPPMRGWLAAPLIARNGQNLGLVQLSDKVGPGGELAEFDAQDEALLVQLAQLAALTLEKGLTYEREHETALALQRSLLPRLPALPGVELAVRYVPAGAGLEVGGDWYDAFPLPDGWVGLALGDVVGHGLRSASLMGQVRVALRAYATVERSPADVVAHLDRLVAGLGEEPMATLAFGTWHPVNGVLHLVLAGHPAPLVREPDGRVHALTAAPGLPLGVAPGGGYEQIELQLDPGATLLWFSDGLVESRSRPVGQGLEELEHVLRDGPGPLEELSDHLVKVMTADGTDDDVAVLLVRALPEV